MRRYPHVTKDIQLAAKIIASGRVVAFPTGTSYGLAVDALQGNALQRLRNLKGRAVEKTFTVFMQPSLQNAFLDLTPQEVAFLQAHQGAPITLLVKPKQALAHLSQDGLIGLRVIDHPLMAQLAQSVEVPLTATSANISNRPACFDIACVQTHFPGILDPTDTRHGDIAQAGKTTYDLSLGAILDAGPLSTRGASTIVRLQEHGEIKVIRQGNARF